MKRNDLTELHDAADTLSERTEELAYHLARLEQGVSQDKRAKIHALMTQATALVKDALALAGHKEGEIRTPLPPPQSGTRPLRRRTSSDGYNELARTITGK